MPKKLTHTNEKGKLSMVDVTAKPAEVRTAKAEGKIMLEPGTIGLIRDNEIKKGDVLTVAEVAGIQAAKMTHTLIPLCHPLPITKVDVKATLTDEGVTVSAMARCTGRTGIEMEALTAVSVALLTVYDMCKAVDKGMVMGWIRLVEKRKEYE